MAATAIKINPEAVAVDCYPRKVQELTDVISSHSLRFRRIALGHLGNAADAEDAVQDTLLSALRHVEQFTGRAKMSTWLTAIVINSARMKLRRRPHKCKSLWMNPVASRISPRQTWCRIPDRVRKRYIASDKLPKRWLMRLRGSRPFCSRPFDCAMSMV
jgi:DNA-directed RNA polymerase specialized sigma24 family protein